VRIGLLAAAGWLVAALLTVGISSSAVSVVRDAVAPQSPVAAGLPTPEETTPGGTTAGGTTAGPTGSAGPSPTASQGSAAPTAAAGRPVSVSGQGGTAIVRCVGGTPEFRNVMPRQGYQARADDSPGEVEFRSSEHRTEITATCAGSTVRTSVEEKDDSGGGSGGNSGPGGGDDD
jgi:hypothetical protein